jgi:hypothetical protein
MGGRGREHTDRARASGDVEPRPAGHVRHDGAGALGDEARRGDVPDRQATLLDERVEPAVRDVGERERRRAHRAVGPDRLAQRADAGRGPRAADRERDDEVSEAVLRRGADDLAVERRRTVGRRGERLVA